MHDLGPIRYVLELVSSYSISSDNCWSLLGLRKREDKGVSEEGSCSHLTLQHPIHPPSLPGGFKKKTETAEFNNTVVKNRAGLCNTMARSGFQKERTRSIDDNGCYSGY